MPVTILFEDNHVLALDKPSGLPTQPHPGFSTSLEEEAKAYIKTRDNKPGNVFLHAIFRLDTNASGIVLFAKSQKALSRLSTSLQRHEFQKEYIAVIEKPLSPRVYECYLLHGDHKAEIATAHTTGAKLAKLNILSSDEIAPHQHRLRIQLVTGRYHQIRAQLASLGAPIIGDKKYGSSIQLDNNQIALLHAELRFIHPISKELITLQSLQTMQHWRHSGKVRQARD